MKTLIPTAPSLSVLLKSSVVDLRGLTNQEDLDHMSLEETLHCRYLCDTYKYEDCSRISTILCVTKQIIEEGIGPTTLRR